MALTNDEADASPTFGLNLCSTGKYRYDTRPAADRGAAAFLRHVRRPMMIYRCAECHGWHLGSSLSRGKFNR